MHNHKDVAGKILTSLIQKYGINGYSLNQIIFSLETNREIFLKSKSQILQDIFVLQQLEFKKNGFFVEFGATNGIDMSNTYLLETDYQWSGIVAEPALCWHEQLFKNRTCFIETKCVWDKSDESILFNEVESAATLSTVDSFGTDDMHNEAGKSGTKYRVNTISFNDMLLKFSAPEYIDYLSIDTEGSEYKIIQSIDFNKYKIKIITCEHNYTDNREKINSFLRGKGYLKKFENLSLFDDWYILQN